MTIPQYWRYARTTSPLTSALTGVTTGVQQEEAMRGEAAKTALARQQARFMPLTMALKAGQENRMSSRFGSAYQLSRMVMSMPKPAREQWMANHAEAWSNTLAILGNKSDQEQNNMHNQWMEHLMRQVFPNMPHTPVTDQPVAASPPPAAAPYDQTPKQTAAQELVNLNMANRDSITNQQRARVDSAVALEKWLQNAQKQYAPRIHNALSYAGTIGKGKKVIDMLRLKSPQTYQDYLWYKQVFTPNFINQVRMMERMGVTDKQRGELNRMFSDVEKISVDPRAARKLFNKMIGSMQDISDAVFQAGEPINKGITRKLHNLKHLDRFVDEGDKAALKPGQIRVRKKLGGQTGVLDKKDYDPTIYEITE